MLLFPKVNGSFLSLCSYVAFCYNAIPVSDPVKRCRIPVIL